MKFSLLCCLSHFSSPRSNSAAWLLLQHCSWPLLQGTGTHNHPCSSPSTSTQTTVANPLYPYSVRAASKTSSRRAAPKGSRAEGAAVGAAGSRQPSREDNASKLALWRAGNHFTPPVHFMEGMAAPTALSWLRRRGPEVHHGILYKMFRARMVRIFSPAKGTVSRVSRSRVLHEGEVLLFPKQLPSEEGHRPIPKPPRAAAAASRTGYEQQEEEEEQVMDTWLPPAQARKPPASSPEVGGRQAERHSAAAQAPPSPGQLLLLETDDLVFINKPAMTSVQGPEPGSLETLVTGLKRSPADPDFKLVHRLDRRVSGVMMMARDADAAAWVTACFRDKATQALLQLEQERCNARARQGLPFKPPPSPLPQREPLPEGLSIGRTYWALLHGRLEPGDAGRITLPVPLPGAGSGPARPAVTQYRVLASSHRLSWVELSPMTGRRHQLRYHCWKGLGAPIVGDENYGFRGLDTRHVLHADAMDKAWWEKFGPAQPQAQAQHRARFEPYNSRDVPIHLHSRQLTMTFATQRPLQVVAPAPGYMSALLASMAWDKIET